MPDYRKNKVTRISKFRVLAASPDFQIRALAASPDLEIQVTFQITLIA